MKEESQPAPQFPSYTPPTPQGIPLADHKQSGVLAKRISKMLPKIKAPRGIQSNQNVHIKHGKFKKHPNPVPYY